MLELKSCPHCNGNGRIVSVSGFKSDRYRAVCEECGASTRECETEQEAVSAWNMRADGWISVKDRLPEPNVIVLCFTNKGYVDTDSFGRYSKVFLKCDDMEGKVGQVIAWMPMPEPPKEEHHE